MKTIQQQTTQTIPGLTSMKLPSLTLISRLVSLAAFVLVVAAPPQSARAQSSATVTTLYTFAGSDGSYPVAGLLQASDGNFYGTSSGGTIFKITPAGVLTTIYLFSGSDGSDPEGALLQASDGNIYGTTSHGGANGKGTVFKITLAGALSTLHSFSGIIDGASPKVGLIQGSDGNFYGTTPLGGSSGSGTVFRITPAGTLTTLHSFSGSDGDYPDGELIQGSDGNFYGGTFFGGTLFKITPAGSLTTFHTFSGSDGSDPEGALLQASDGNFYGTTVTGGTNNDGTVFKITPAGVLTSLYSFSGGDGQSPRTGLIRGSDGNLYGTTDYGGANGVGTLFQITPAGVLTSLYSFSGGHNGPEGALVQGSDGDFYGTTQGGGANGLGTIFRLNVTLGPPPTPTPSPSGNLLNIATRLKVLTGDNVLIGGFIITGTDPKKVLILGIGPSLAQFFSGSLSDPTLELYQGNTLLQMNDNWKTDQQAEIEATGIPPSNDLESAIVRTLDPGSYTAILRGKGDATGIGVVQAYDLNQAANSKFGNIATRGFVDSGDNAMIGGFIIGPASGGSTAVVVRAIGPSLTNFGVSGALPDPTVELHDGNGATIAFNDNWADDANQRFHPAISEAQRSTRECALPGAATR